MMALRDGRGLPKLSARELGVSRSRPRCRVGVVRRCGSRRTLRSMRSRNRSGRVYFLGASHGETNSKPVAALATTMLIAGVSAVFLVAGCATKGRVVGKEK